MITVNIIHDEKRIAELSGQNNLEGYEYMSTVDGETEKAVAAVRAEGEMLFMELLSAAEPDMGDMAIRAALAYGDNRGCVTAQASDRQFERLLKCVGFCEKDGVYEIEISKVVHYCG